MAMDSVPPSVALVSESNLEGARTLTGKRSSYEDRCKAAKAADKRSITDVPVMRSKIHVLCVCSAVHYYSENDEYLGIVSLDFSMSQHHEAFKLTVIVTTFRKLNQYSN